MSKKVTNELNDLQARIHDFHQALDSLSFSSSSKKQNKIIKIISTTNRRLNQPKNVKERLILYIRGIPIELKGR